MAGYRKRNTEGPNSEDKALDLFAEMMIEKIESIQKDWHKPWLTEGTLQWPRNLSGREYNGLSAHATPYAAELALNQCRLHPYICLSPSRNCVA